MNVVSPFVEFSLTAVNQSLGERFEEQVRLRGDTLAVCDRDQTYTYAELNAAANAVAHTLHARQPRAEEVVAVLVPDGAAMIVALLGVWKAGKIAIPIDPALPRLRLRQMLDESAAEVLLATDAATAADFSDAGLPIVDIESAEASGSAENLAATVPADALAIVLFTSGSTGKPRGVVLDHRGLVYRAMLMANLYECRPGDRQLIMSSCRHIAGTIVLLKVLLTGGTVFPFNLKHDLASSVAEALRTHAITIFATITTIARQVIGAARSRDQFPDLRVIAMGGEPVLYRDLARFAPHVSPSCRFVNVIGSTEFLLYGAHVVDRGRLEADGQVPISDSKTLPVDLRLVDDVGREVGANEVGEMLVRSRYLARGYWQQPDLTAAAFVPDPDDPGITAFRTGDLGVRRDDGRIFYMGRKDAQVKVHGYRIEPIEVEMALLDHPDVAECAVVASERAPGDRQLVAYLRPRDGVVLDVRSVIAHARARLPDYMVPSAFPIVSTLGQTHSGKIDRRSLPPFDWSSYRPPAVGGEPRTETERALLKIWREVLGHDDVGIHDDFLEQGGDSLLAIRLFSRIEEVLGRKLDLGILFNAGTIAKQAELIESQAATPTVVAIQPAGTRPAFFCVPGFDGEVMVFTHLARQLGADQPFYALYPRFIEDTCEGAVSVETVAAHYVEAICSSYPQDRYFIGGYSSGGVVALEVARLLSARGHQVALVALLDSFAANEVGPTALAPSAVQSIARFTEHFLSPADNRLQLVRALQAVRRHVSSAYAGRVDLFRARETGSPDDHGWDRLARDLHIHDVAGDHVTMLKAPHVQDLAARLRAVMDSISAVSAVAGES